MSPGDLVKFYGQLQPTPVGVFEFNLNKDRDDHGLMEMGLVLDVRKSVYHQVEFDVMVSGIIIREVLYHEWMRLGVVERGR
jgi:hypothetical protein